MELKQQEKIFCLFSMLFLHLGNLLLSPTKPPYFLFSCFYPLDKKKLGFQLACPSLSIGEFFSSYFPQKLFFMEIGENIVDFFIFYVQK